MQPLTVSRRKVLTTAVGAGTAAIASRAGAGGSAVTGTSTQAPPLPESLLINRSRAAELMTQHGIDALAVRRPENIYYLTNHFPQLARMGMTNLSCAVLPADPKVPPVLVISEFSFFLGAAEQATKNFVDVRLYTSPAEPETFASLQSFEERSDASALPTLLKAPMSTHPLSEAESNRYRSTADVTREMAATSEAALFAAARDLSLFGKVIAVDDASLQAVFQDSGSRIRHDADWLLRAVRLQKSKAELPLVSYAARMNAESGREAARLVRDGATFQDVRAAYAEACVRRMLTPDFMVIDGVIPPMAPGKVEEGRAFLIDCVSRFQHYCGDYGRTVCVGEPTREIAQVTKNIETVWDALLPQLKAGMRYSEVRTLAADIYRKLKSSVPLVCNPHSVGLNHTDEPGIAGQTQWTKADLTLEENMVLSVDLPVLAAGIGGTAHLEDLVLIGADGAKLLNDGGDRVIVV